MKRTSNQARPKRLKRAPVRLFDMKRGLASEGLGSGVDDSPSEMRLSEMMQNDLRIASQVKPHYDTEAGLARFAALASAGAGGVAASQVVSQGSAAAKVGAFLKGITLLKGALMVVGAVGVLGGAVAVVQGVGGSEKTVPTTPMTTTPMTNATATATPMTNATATAMPTPMTSATTSGPSPANAKGGSNASGGGASSGAASSGGDGAKVDGSQADSSKADGSKAALVKAELEQLVAVRNAQSPAETLRLAEEGLSHYPHGVFGQEREILAIRALVKLGRRGEAATRAHAFVERHPESPYSEELRALGE